MTPTLAPVFDEVRTPEYQTSSTWTEMSEPEDTPWLVGAAQKLLALRRLRDDWDSYGSGPVDRDVVRTALGVVVLVWRYLSDGPAPEILPMSGGSVQLVWSTPGRQIELDVLRDGSVRALKLEDDDPVGDDEQVEVTKSKIEALFDWL